jgi:hypothetical protein
MALFLFQFSVYAAATGLRDPRIRCLMTRRRSLSPAIEGHCPSEIVVQ